MGRSAALAMGSPSGFLITVLHLSMSVLQLLETKAVVLVKTGAEFLITAMIEKRIFPHNNYK